MTEHKDKEEEGGGGAGGGPRNLPNMNLLRNAAIVSIVTETLSIESPFPCLPKSSAMWCEADVQSLRLALLPAELSFSKMPKSQEIENASHARFLEKNRLKARKRCQRLRTLIKDHYLVLA